MTENGGVRKAKGDGNISPGGAMLSRKRLRPIATRAECSRGCSDISLNEPPLPRQVFICACKPPGGLFSSGWKSTRPLESRLKKASLALIEKSLRLPNKPASFPTGCWILRPRRRRWLLRWSPSFRAGEWDRTFSPNFTAAVLFSEIPKDDGPLRNWASS